MHHPVAGGVTHPVGGGVTLLDEGDVPPPVEEPFLVKELFSGGGDYHAGVDE